MRSKNAQFKFIGIFVRTMIMYTDDDDVLRALNLSIYSVVVCVFRTQYNTKRTTHPSTVYYIHAIAAYTTREI